MPQLIEVKLIINESLETFGIYDSGSNVSLINSKLLKLKNENLNLEKNVNLTTINGVRKSNGIVKLKLKIFEIEDEMNVFLIDEQNFNYDFLIVLDIINKFKLTQNVDLKIIQKVPDLYKKNFF